MNDATDSKNIMSEISEVVDKPKRGRGRPKKQIEDETITIDHLLALQPISSTVEWKSLKIPIRSISTIDLLKAASVIDEDDTAEIMWLKERAAIVAECATVEGLTYEEAIKLDQNFIAEVYKGIKELSEISKKNSKL